MSNIYKSADGAEAVRRRYEDQLERWPVPFDRLRIPTSSGETFVVASGPADAPAVVLLHGSGANASTWAGDVATWSSAFRVYAVDMLGEPGRSAEVRLPLENDATAKWMDEVLDGLGRDGLGLDSVGLVGMSLGGWAALDYTIRRPERIRSLAVLCPGGIGRQTYSWVPAALLLGAFGTRGRRSTVRLVTGLSGSSMKDVLDDVTLTFSHFEPRTEKLPIFSDVALQSISIPVLVIVGERDRMMKSSETAERVARCIPNASVTVMPGVGHAVLGQTDAIMEFLQRR